MSVLLLYIDCKPRRISNNSSGCRSVVSGVKTPPITQLNIELPNTAIIDSYSWHVFHHYVGCVDRLCNIQQIDGFAPFRNKGPPICSSLGTSKHRSN